MKEGILDTKRRIRIQTRDSENASWKKRRIHTHTKGHTLNKHFFGIALISENVGIQNACFLTFSTCSKLLFHDCTSNSCSAHFPCEAFLKSPFILKKMTTARSHQFCSLMFGIHIFLHLVCSACDTDYKLCLLSSLSCANFVYYRSKSFINNSL